LILEGKTLDFCLHRDFHDKFLKVAKSCTSVIICRVSPLQKSQVVRAIKRAQPTKATLAIGDGANDVPMIQASDVGVGIIGKEGSQAVRAADFTLGEFRFLELLVLVHGQWAYQRLAKLVLYFFYKNVVMTMTAFWFNMVYAQASGQTIYDSWSLALYNAVFTNFPILIYAILEKEVPEKEILNNPKLYMDGPNRKCVSPSFRLCHSSDSVLNTRFLSIVN
jgi:magnesium-transporting ATPase (P-type)